MFVPKTESCHSFDLYFPFFFWLSVILYRRQSILYVQTVVCLELVVLTVGWVSAILANSNRWHWLEMQSSRPRPELLLIELIVTPSLRR